MAVQWEWALVWVGGLEHTVSLLGGWWHQEDFGRQTEERVKEPKELVWAGGLECRISLLRGP